jgi:hypothetical protein
MERELGKRSSEEGLVAEVLVQTEEFRAYQPEHQLHQGSKQAALDVAVAVLYHQPPGLHRRDYKDYRCIHPFPHENSLHFLQDHFQHHVHLDQELQGLQDHFQYHH